MKDYKVKNKKKVVAKKSYRKDMYAFGGTVQDRLNDYLQIQTSRKNAAPNLIQTPDAAIVESQIREATAAQNASNSTMGKIAKVGSAVGGMALNYGVNMAIGGIKNGDLGKLGGGDGVEGFKMNESGFNALNSNANIKTPTMESGMSSLTSIDSKPLYKTMKFPKMAMGGVVAPQNVNVEVEGGERVKLPGEATSMPVVGASHEQGGVNATLPAGTQIFSKQLEKKMSKEDKSFAEREKLRSNYIKRLEAQLEKDPTNSLVRKTLEKVSNNAQMQSEKDIAEMEQKKMELEYGETGNINLDKSNQIDQALATSQEKFKFGGTIDPPKKKFFTTNYDDLYNPVINTEYKEKFSGGGTIDPPFKKFRTSYADLNGLYDIAQGQQPKYAMQKKWQQEGLDNDYLEQDNNRQRFIPVQSVNPNSYEGEAYETNQRFIPNIMKLGTGPESYYDVGQEEESKFSWETPKQEPIGDKIVGDGKGGIINKTNPVFNDPKRKVDATNFGDKGLNLNFSKGADMVQNFMKGKNGITTGDALGLYGMYNAMNDPMKNTLANRAGDTVNSNFYKDYGKEGIKVLEDSKRMLMANKDQAMLDAQSQYINLGARSANVMNSLKLVEQMGKNQNITNANLNYANQKNAIQSQIAGAENQQDQMVMQGEQQATLANQQDRDNFNKQMAKDIETKNFGMQKIGGTLNQVKERNVNLNLIDQLYEDFGINGMTGQMRRKTVETIKNNPQFYTDLSREDGDIIHKGVASGELVVKNNKLYDKNGVELDKKTRKPFGYVAPVVASEVAPVVNAEATPEQEQQNRINQSFSGNGLGFDNKRFMPINANPLFFKR